MGKFLGNIKVDIAFLGSSGFQGHNGPTSIDFTDAEVKQVVMANSNLSIVLAHSEKTKSTALLSYASWKDIDYLITDDQIEPEEEESLSKQVQIIKVSIADKEST